MKGFEKVPQCVIIYLMRCWFSGRMPAFQAGDKSSILLRRTNMQKIKKYFFLLLVIGLASVGLYGYFVFGNQMRSGRGMVKGNDYIATMYSDYHVSGQSCQGEDTNKDTYITCNFRLQKIASGEEKTITLQCPTFWKSFMYTNCKEQGIVINQQ